MSGFSRVSSASPCGPCVKCCKADKAADDQLASAAGLRMQVLARSPPTGMNSRSASAPNLAQGSPSASAPSTCFEKATKLAPVLQRFNRYRDALPSARAVSDMSDLGDGTGDEPTKMRCVTRLPVDAEKLNQALKFPPGSITDEDLRLNKNGFRAAIYRDEESGKLLLVSRDTEPHSLADWATNTDNGTGKQTDQYIVMRRLTSKLTAAGLPFDIAGYSKGGGLAQESGLMSPLSTVRVFNSAGLPDAALDWTNQSSFDSLISRTSAFNAQNDFLTYMNDTADPRQKILNADFLWRQLSGKTFGVNPISIDFRNPEMHGQPDPKFAGDKAKYLDNLEDQIKDMQSTINAGGDISGLPPVRAGIKETVVDSASQIGNALGASSNQLNIGKLYQHAIGNLLGAMTSSVQNDRFVLQKFLESCG